MIYNKKAMMALNKLIALILMLIVFLVLILYSPTIYSRTHTGVNSAIFSQAEIECKNSFNNNFASNIINCDKQDCSLDKTSLELWKNYVSYLNGKICPGSGDVGAEKEKACTCVQQAIFNNINGNNNPQDNTESQLSDALVQISTGSQIDPTTVKIKYKDLEPEFTQKVQKIANNLGTKPEYLMASMAFETGGTFDPCIKNAAGSGATGLIQFMPKTAIGLKTTTDDLCKMTRVEQLDYVEKHFLPKKGKLNTLNDVYLTILYPDAVGKGDEYILFKEGTKAYIQNAKLDTNRNGEITAGEAVSKVASRYDPSIFIG